MADVLYRNAREWFKWPVTASNADGEPVTLTEVGVTFSPVGATPGPAASFTTAPVVAGKARLLLAGPAASGSGAVVLPIGIWVPWFRVVTDTEVILRPGPQIVVARSA